MRYHGGMKKLMIIGGGAAGLAAAVAAADALRARGVRVGADAGADGNGRGTRGITGKGSVW